MLKVLTPLDISKQLQIRIRAVYRLISQGKLKAFRVGNKLRVMEEDFHKFIKDQSVKDVIEKAPSRLGH